MKPFNLNVGAALNFNQNSNKIVGLEQLLNSSETSNELGENRVLNLVGLGFRNNSFGLPTNFNTNQNRKLRVSNNVFDYQEH